MTPAETSGITHRRILRIAVPMVLSSITVPLLGLVDTGVVGQMGQAAPIAAVGIGALILGALYWIFGFLRMGMTGLVSQAVGRGDRPEEIALLSRGLLMGFLGGAALIVLQIPLFWAGFALSPASAEVENLARAYMAIRIWGAPAAIGLYAITGWLIARERSVGVLVLQLVMNGLNIALDMLFVLQFDMGAEGVAWATLIAEYTGLALGLWLCRDVFEGSLWRDRARVFDVALLRHALVVNRDILLRSLLLQAIFLSFLLYGGHFGDVTLAANHVLLLFLEVTAYGMDGFAFSAETLVGQAAGARDRTRLRRAVVMCSIWCAALGVVLMLGFALAGGWGIDRMTTSEEVRAAARIYLPWMIIAPVVGIGAWMFDGVYIGATWAREMRNMMVLSAAVYAASFALLVPLWDNHGLWCALILSFIARSATLGARYPTLERSVA